MGKVKNSVAAKALQEDLVAWDLKSSRPRMFVFDGSRSLRSAIDVLFGAGNFVQRYRKPRGWSVVGHLPKEHHEQDRATWRAAVSSTPRRGWAQAKQYATWLEVKGPAALAAMREGLEAMFTIHGLRPSDQAELLPEDDEPDWQRSVGIARPGASGEGLAEQAHGGAVDGSGLRGDLGEVSSDHGARRTVDDVEGGPR